MAHGKFKAIFARPGLKRCGGPTGQLGFPTSNENAHPSNNGRYSNFQKGVILWRGNYNSMFAITALDIYLERYDAKGTHTFAEKYLGVSIWLYVNVNVHASSGEHFQQRMPASGHWTTSTETIQKKSILKHVPVVRMAIRLSTRPSMDGMQLLSVVTAI